MKSYNDKYQLESIMVRQLNKQRILQFDLNHGKHIITNSHIGYYWQNSRGKLKRI